MLVPNKKICQEKGKVQKQTLREFKLACFTDMQSNQLLKTYASTYPKPAPGATKKLVLEQIPGFDLGKNSSIKHIHL